VWPNVSRRGASNKRDGRQNRVGRKCYVRHLNNQYGRPESWRCLIGENRIVIGPDFRGFVRLAAPLRNEMLRGNPKQVSSADQLHNSPAEEVRSSADGNEPEYECA